MRQNGVTKGQMGASNCKDGLSRDSSVQRKIAKNRQLTGARGPGHELKRTTGQGKQRQEVVKVVFFSLDYIFVLFFLCFCVFVLLCFLLIGSRNRREEQ